MNRSNFSFFSKNKYKLAYCDSAATTLKLECVIQELERLYALSGNARRGLYNDSEELASVVEDTRKAVANFLQVTSEEIIFTKNATESLNLVALCWGENNIQEGDHIVVTAREHHANFVPWQQLAHRKKAKFVVIPVDHEGELVNSWKEYISLKTKILAIGHISNVTGVCFKEMQTLVTYARSQGAFICIDGAQAVSFIEHPLKDLKPDFYAFSAHKMMAPVGVGILYVAADKYQQMHPIMFGGGAVFNVSEMSTQLLLPPYCYELGTLPSPEIGAFKKALEYLRSYGVAKNAYHANQLVRLFLDSVDHSKIRIIGNYERVYKESHIVSFVVNGIHAHDVAAYLNEKSIAVRAGNHCAQPFHIFLKIDASVRVSFYGYNTSEDVRVLVKALHELLS